MVSPEETYQALVQQIINSNSDVLDADQLQIVLSRYASDDPNLEKITIDEELKVSGQLADGDVALRTWKHLTDILQEFLGVLVGNLEAITRMQTALSSFDKENWVEELKGFLPDFLGDEGIVEEKPQSEQLVSIFKELFKAFFSMHPPSQKLYEEASFKLSITDDGMKFEISDEEHLLEDLCSLFNNLALEEMDLSSATKMVQPLVENYESLPVTPQVMDNLLNGILSTHVPLGIPLVDAYHGNRVPKGRGVTLLGPPCNERELITLCFIKEALVSGGSALVVLSSISVEEFKQLMASLQVNVDQYKEALQIVDWYTFNLRRVVGMEDDGNITVAASSLTSLGIAIDSALKKLPDRPSKKMVLDVLSPMRMSLGFDEAYDFIQSMRNKLRKKEVTFMLPLDPNMHSHEELSTISNIMDGHIELKINIDGGKIKKTLRIHQMGEEFVDANYLIGWESGHLSIQDESGLEREEMDLLPSSKLPIRFNIENFDKVGSVRQGDIILLQGPSSKELDALTHSLFNQWVDEKKDLILTLSNVSPDSFMSSIGGVGSVPKENLFIVDWNSYKNQRIIGIETEGNVAKPSQDISHLAISMDQAIEYHSSKEDKRALLDILSQAMSIFSFPSAYNFAKSIRARLKKADVTTILLIDSEMHEPYVLTAMQQMCDATIDIDRDGSNVTLAMLSSRTGFSSNSYMAIEMDNGSISLSPLAEEEETSFFDGISQVSMPDISELGKAGEEVEALMQRLRSKENTLKKREKRLVFREQKLKRRQEEFKSRLKQFQDEILRHMKDKDEIYNMQKMLMEGRDNLKKEREEVKKLWDALHAQEKVLDKKK